VDTTVIRKIKPQSFPLAPVTPNINRYNEKKNKTKATNINIYNSPISPQDNCFKFKQIAAKTNELILAVPNPPQISSPYPHT